MNDDQILAYVMGEMSETDQNRFERQLAADSELADRVAQYREIEELFALESRERPTEALTTRFEMLLKDTMKSKYKPLEKRPLKLLNWKIVAVAASILVAVTFLGRGWFAPGDLSQGTSITKSTISDTNFGHLISNMRPTQRIKGIRLTNQVVDLDPEIIKALEEVIFNDPSTNVRLAAIEALAPYVSQDDIKEMLLMALQTVDIPIVRIQLIKVLTVSGEDSVVPQFEELLRQEDLNEAVRDELHFGLLKLY